MIQVITGTFKGRRLVLPKGTHTRPTTSQMRQAVFNICQNEVEGASFLDICAGSGSMGIEALSRGASFATFIDSSHFALEAIRQNIKSLQLEEVSHVLGQDALPALKRLEKEKKVFDLCYFDPPYGTALSEQVLHFLDESTLFTPNSLLFMEEGQHFSLEKITLKTLTLKSERRFGTSSLFCFSK
jgi:16S rRNA (guanine(966)-N(2))-methyltransferase RsmD